MHLRGSRRLFPFHSCQVWQKVSHSFRKKRGLLLDYLNKVSSATIHQVFTYYNQFFEKGFYMIRNFEGFGSRIASKLAPLYFWL